MTRSAKIALSISAALIFSFPVFISAAEQEQTPKGKQVDFPGFYEPGYHWKEKRILASGETEIAEYVVLEDNKFNGLDVIQVMTKEKQVTKIYDRATMGFIAQKKGDRVIMSTLPHDGRYAWPLWVGKKWTFYFDFNVSKGKTMKVPKKYQVEKIENITVPAGTFETFKIIGVSGRRVKNTLILWWSPRVKMPVKVEHFRGDKNIISYELLTLPTR